MYTCLLLVYKKISQGTSSNLCFKDSISPAAFSEHLIPCVRPSLAFAPLLVSMPNPNHLILGASLDLIPMTTVCPHLHHLIMCL